MNRALTNKILITLAFLFAYRVLAYVPVPGVNADVIANFLITIKTMLWVYLMFLVVERLNAFLSFL